MFSESLDTIVQTTGGKLLQGPRQLGVAGVFTDTRAVVMGGLFVALRGDNFDGNVFARQAVEVGAAAVIIDRKECAASIPAKAGVILVKDSRQAYLSLAFHHRSQLTRARWFGITGSVGKSSVKEMLAHILECTGRKVHKAKASFNNAVGLSATVLGATPEHEAVVLELGTNHPGEIAQLAAVARPDIAVLTCAAESHLEAFGTVADVAQEKGQILAYQNPDGVSVLNADDPHFFYWRRVVPGQVISFGRDEDAIVRATDLRTDGSGCAEFTVRCERESAPCRLRIVGIHQMLNATAAMAAAYASGVCVSDSAHALNSFSGVARRLALRQTRGVTLIDDAYNANPASFNAALETLKQFRAERKFLIAGDMLELGPNSENYHRQLGRLIADCDLTTVVTVGPMASVAGAAAIKERPSRLSWVACASPAEAAAALKSTLRPGDVVLLKASHGVHLEQCVDMLSA